MGEADLPKKVLKDMKEKLKEKKKKVNHVTTWKKKPQVSIPNKRKCEPGKRRS